MTGIYRILSTDLQSQVNSMLQKPTAKQQLRMCLSYLSCNTVESDHVELLLTMLIPLDQLPRVFSMQCGQTSDGIPIPSLFFQERVAQVYRFPEPKSS